MYYQRLSTFLDFLVPNITSARGYQERPRDGKNFLYLSLNLLFYKEVKWVFMREKKEQKGSTNQQLPIISFSLYIDPSGFIQNLIEWSHQ